MGGQHKLSRKQSKNELICSKSRTKAVMVCNLFNDLALRIYNVFSIMVVSHYRKNIFGLLLRSSVYYTTANANLATTLVLTHKKCSPQISNNNCRNAINVDNRLGKPFDCSSISPKHKNTPTTQVTDYIKDYMHAKSEI